MKSIRQKSKVDHADQPVTMLRVVEKILLQLVVLLAPIVAWADEAPSEHKFQAGLRAGYSIGAEVTQAEVAAGYRLPLSLSFGRGFSFASQLEGAIGWIGDGQDNTSIGSIGASVRLEKARFPVSFVLGLDPTIIGSNTIGGRDLGAALQFTSYLGFEWQMNDRLALG